MHVNLPSIRRQRHTPDPPQLGPSLRIYCSSFRCKQKAQHELREWILEGLQTEDGEGDPASMMFEALVQRGTGLEGNEAFCRTVKACGMALEWTNAGCHRHKGRITSCEKDSMRNDYFTPLLLAFERDNIIEVQDVIDLIEVDIAVVTEDPKMGKTHDWPTSERFCFFCEEENGQQVSVTHTMRVDGDGPTHFFAQNIRFMDPRVAGNEGGKLSLSPLEPTLEINIFGRAYMLLAVVYYCAESSHFSSQVFLPAVPC